MIIFECSVNYDVYIRVTATVQVAQAIPKHCLVLHIYMYVSSPGDGTVTVRLVGTCMWPFS